MERQVDTGTNSGFIDSITATPFDITLLIVVLIFLIFVALWSGLQIFYLIKNRKKSKQTDIAL